MKWLAAGVIAIIGLATGIPFLFALATAVDQDAYAAATPRCNPAGTSTATGLPPEAEPYAAEAVAAAQRHQLDRPAVFLALIGIESGWNPDAHSPAGAIGLTQLMPATAHALGVIDPWDPTQNLDGGARALTGRINAKAGDYRAALAGYNGGTNPPPSSWQYADDVLAGAATIQVTATPLTIPAACVNGKPPTGPVPMTDTVLVQNAIRVHVAIASQVDAMMSAAAVGEVTLRGAGWRSSDQQWSLRQSHCPDPVNSPASACSPPTAKVGESMHEQGLAIDFILAPGVWNWLVAHAAEFGFRNLPSERWHWSVNGK